MISDDSMTIISCFFYDVCLSLKSSNISNTLGPSTSLCLLYRESSRRYLLSIPLVPILEPRKTTLILVYISLCLCFFAKAMHCERRYVEQSRQWLTSFHCRAMTITKKEAEKSPCLMSGCINRKHSCVFYYCILWQKLIAREHLCNVVIKAASSTR